MIQIRRVLYINSEKTYLSCDHETILVHRFCDDREQTTRIPVTAIEQIIMFGETSISSPLIGFCSKHGITISFVSYHGYYYGRTIGTTKGNILLRKRQYDLFNDEAKRLCVVKNIILGKGVNEIETLSYFEHNGHKASVISHGIDIIRQQLKYVLKAESREECRGYEGVMASAYFNAFDEVISPKDESLYFVKRSKRPPENRCNALLSFLYTLLNLNCISALETFGLDSYLGYMHEMRPGRESLANDLIEEMRAPLVDKWVASVINTGQIKASDFSNDNGEFLLLDQARIKILGKWEEEKSTSIYYPFLKKDVPKKLIPYLQAQLLSQFVRGDIQEYPPFYFDWRN